VELGIHFLFFGSVKFQFQFQQVPDKSFRPVIHPPIELTQAHSTILSPTSLLP
jgi:hypothetical protein